MACLLALGGSYFGHRAVWVGVVKVGRQPRNGQDMGPWLLVSHAGSPQIGSRWTDHNLGFN